MQVAFRVDASAEIGSGHLMRCLALAHELVEQGAAVAMMVRTTAGPLIDVARAKGHRVLTLPETCPPLEPCGAAAADAILQDAAVTRELLRSLGVVDWLVVDHYGLDEGWERFLRAEVKQVMVIDDLPGRPHDCDVFLDQNVDDVDSARRVPADCLRLFGPRFALLRAEFARVRQNISTRNGSIDRILVSFGGTDPTNETVKALDAIEMLCRPDLAVDVVVGGAASNAEQVRTRISDWPQARFFRQVDTMAELMAAADLAIGAGGSTSWERCCLGLPSITVCVADNQRAVVERLGDVGASVNLGDAANVSAADLAAAIRTLLAAPGLCRSLSERSGEMCDGRGAARVARSLRLDAGGLEAGKVVVRSATIGDSALLLAWRNDPDIRKFALQSDIISQGDHDRWIERVLADPRHIVLIGERDGVAFGVVRYACAGDSATISVAVDPKLQGQSLGGLLISQGAAWLRRERPEVKRVCADVLPGNAASHSVFRKAGFALRSLRYEMPLGDDVAAGLLNQRRGNGN